MQTLGKCKNAKSCTDKYVCKICDYSTSRKSSYDKHILTPKHKLRISEELYPHKCLCGKQFTRNDNLQRHKKSCKYEENTKPKELKVAECLPKVCHGFECVCGKTYKHACSLSKHKKNCLHITKTINEPKNNNSEVLEILGSLKQYWGL
jgi:uncharacterized Zn-finger protein